MHTRYKLKTAPTQWPATLAEVKKNLRIDASDTDTDRDELLTDKIKEATAASQSNTGRQYCRATYIMYLDEYPVNDEVEITLGPVASIVSVKYLAKGASTYTTVLPSTYQLDNVELTARLRFLESFSPDSDKMNVIAIELLNGWDDVPDDSTTTAAPTTTGSGTTTAAPTTTEAPTTTFDSASVGYLPADLKEAVILRACEGYLNPENQTMNFGMGQRITAAENKERPYRVQRY